MVNQTLVHLYHGILLSTKKEQTIDTHNKLDASPGDHVEFKRPIPKGHIPYITFLKGQNDGENRLVVVKGGGGRGGGWGMGRGRWAWLQKGNCRDPGGDGDVVHHDCILVNTLLVTLHCGFATCYTGAKE